MFGSYALTFGRGEHRHALRQKAKAAGLAIADQPALLFLAEERTSLLSGEGIILVGQLFSGTNEPLAALPPIDGSGLAGLRSAFDGFWGNFALFRATPEEWMAYRDPSGTVPIYRCGSGDNAVFVSDAAIAGRLGLLAHPRRDLRFAAHWLQFPFLQTRRSGLEEVAELLPGMAAEKAPSGSWAETLLWRPADFIRKAQAVRDPREAAGRLRDLALKVVAAQPGSSAVLLQLSGGLDSSIVAACLSQAGRTFSCVNFATRSLDGDERQYARDVARAFNLPLTELIEAEPAAIGSDPRPSFRPLTNPLLAPFERAVASAAELMDGALIVDGAGGDNLFCSITSAAPVLDALRWGGSVAARTAASNIALRAGCTVWEVVAAAARRLVARRPMWKEDRTFLDPAALLRGPEVHPWLEGLEAILPGKREHVEALVHIQHFLDRGPGGMARLHPLMAQPLLELCLTIPSWLWMHGGRDRAIARDAFAGLVPQSVLRRRAKGSLQSLFHRSFAALRPQMRDTLMSGELHRAGILDSSRLERAFAGDSWTRDEVQLRITELVAMELWLQSWRSPPSFGASAP
ncbi:MAG TPA: asparagine synthase-related protein [Sphingomicrobium sp.]|nr:asparagine synthase-related protein [Sphingomicrobium sp.]